MSSGREYSRLLLKLGAVILVLMVIVLIAGCSKGFISQGEEVSAQLPSILSSNSPANGLVQSSDGGAVTIDVEWQGEENNSLVFSVAMNTHSVDLDEYDLTELAILRDDAGQEYSPVSWDSAQGGHHRSGILSFPFPDSLSNGKTDYMEIVIRDVAGIEERVMRWEM